MDLFDLYYYKKKKKRSLELRQNRQCKLRTSAKENYFLNLECRENDFIFHFSVLKPKYFNQEVCRMSSDKKKFTFLKSSVTHYTSDCTRWKPGQGVCEIYL